VTINADVRLKSGEKVRVRRLERGEKFGEGREEREHRFHSDLSIFGYGVSSYVSTNIIIV